MRDVAAKDVDANLEAGIMERLVSADVASRLVDLIAKYNNGDEVDFYSSVRAEVERFEQQIDRKVKSPEVKDDIGDLLKAEEDDTGFHWRMACLNRSIKPLREGDFAVLSARPDKGKTSFCAAELTHMAAQIDGIYPGEYRPILWLNNEGPGRNIVTRCYQAALEATIEDLVRRNQAGNLRADYAKAIGRADNLRIFDIHDMWNHEVEDLIRLHNPSIVLFDMVDNIKFGGEANNNGQRTDQLLEAMYQWARVLGVKHHCAVLATSQISADGDGMQWPTLPMLKDSKTGKQGAADIIITMGTVNDPMLDNSRYMGTTKNKRKRSGVPSSPMQEVLFDKDRCKFVEIP
jgi:replicative DNA helicase